MPRVTAHPVVSSNIDRVGHHDRTLFISFHHGGIYSYADVPYAVFQALLDAESVGKFFHANIKGKFEFTKLDADPFH